MTLPAILGALVVAANPAPAHKAKTKGFKPLSTIGPAFTTVIPVYMGGDEDRMQQAFAVSIQDENAWDAMGDFVPVGDPTVPFQVRHIRSVHLLVKGTKTKAIPVLGWAATNDLAVYAVLKRRGSGGYFVPTQPTTGPFKYKGTALKERKVFRPSAALAAKLAEQLHKRNRGLPADDYDRGDFKSVKRKHIQLLRAPFGKGVRWLAAVNVAVKTGSWNVALVFIGKSGTVVDWAIEPAPRIERYQIWGETIDEDGDGIYSALFNSSYEKGSFDWLVQPGGVMQYVRGEGH